MKANVTMNEPVFVENIDSVTEAEQMKLFNHTWMSVVETGMPKWIDKDGNYQYDRYLKAREYVGKHRVAVDVGANIGLFTRRMCEDFQTVHCFEPVPMARACLSRNVSANNYILYSYGLGDGDYKTDISYCNSSIGGSTIGRHANEGRTDGKVFAEEQINIQIKTLDSFKLTEVDFIKIDIQGYELEMLQGAIETINKNKPVILVELVADNIEHVEVPKFLATLGYVMKIRMGKDGIFVYEGKSVFSPLKKLLKKK